LGTAADTPVALNMGSGNDTVQLGGAFLFASLDAILAPVTVHGDLGADAVVLDDAGFRIFPVAGSDYTVTATDVTRNGRHILHYVTADSLTLLAGDGNDSIRVASTDVGTPVVINAGFGDDTIEVGNFSATALLGAVTINGQDGSDTLDYSAFNSAVRVN